MPTDLTDVATPGLLPSPVPADGSLDYYALRAADFVTRHPELTPPSYYVEYGEKYAERFTHETASMLSPRGRAWVERARRALQQAIEDRRAADPAAFDALELDDAAFTRFAYDTHPDAYWSAGIGDLDPIDLGIIAATPDASDLLTAAGMHQIADVGARVLVDDAGGDARAELLGAAVATTLVDHAWNAVSPEVHEVGRALHAVGWPGADAVRVSALLALGRLRRLAQPGQAVGSLPRNRST